MVPKAEDKKNRATDKLNGSNRVRHRVGGQKRKRDRRRERRSRNRNREGDGESERKAEIKK